MKAIWSDTIIAESDDIVEVEGNAYFPLAALDRRWIVESATRTVCDWKGEASYYSLKIGAQVNNDAAWYYANPKPAAASIAGRVAFWRGVEIRR